MKETAEVPMLPAGCGYMGHEFGAPYLDAECFGGRLYDMDNCDDHGNVYEPIDYIPCPNCRFKKAVSRLAEDIRCDSRRGRNVKWFLNVARRRIRAYLERNGYGVAGEERG